MYIFEPPHNETGNIGSDVKRFDNLYTENLYIDSTNGISPENVNFSNTEFTADNTKDAIDECFGNVNSYGSTIGNVLVKDIVVNLTASMTEQQINDAIAAVPKNLNNNTVTFQLADGTYDWYLFTSAISISYFCNGTIIFQGNMGETSTTAYNTQAVSLFLKVSIYQLYFYNCLCKIIIRRIRFVNVAPVSSWNTGLYISTCNLVNLEYCSFRNDVSSPVTYGSGFLSSLSAITVNACHMQYLNNASVFQFTPIGKLLNCTIINSNTRHRVVAGSVVSYGCTAGTDGITDGHI